MDEQERQLKLESDRVNTEGQMLLDFVNSDGYKYFKSRVMDIAIEMSDLLNLDTTKYDDMGLLMEIRVRRVCVGVLMDKLREIEGRASQHQDNKQVLIDTKKTDYITFIE